MDSGFTFIILAVIFGLLMTWGVGANDLANIMSTSLGSRSIGVKQAMIIAVVFEILGAFWGGSDVMDTLRRGIINTHILYGPPHLLIYGMLAVLLAGTVWIVLASYLGMPVSITNAIIGAMVGFAVTVFGIHAVYWQQVLLIVVSWLFLPIISGLGAYLFYGSVRRLVLNSADPLENARKYLPFYLFAVGFVLSAMTVIKGLNHFDVSLALRYKIDIAIICGLLVMVVGCFVANRISQTECSDRDEQLAVVEKMFGFLMALTACAMVFAHGSNDVAIAVGPIAVVSSIVQNSGSLSQNTPLPAWTIWVGASGVLTGLFMYGRKVIRTVGSHITLLTPSRAFTATLAAASTVVLLNSSGIPVSTTQILVGAVFGVGLVKGIENINTRVLRNILISWTITLPIACVLAMIFYYMIKAIFE